MSEVTEKEKDNIYIYREDESDLDDSPLNFSSSEIDDDNESAQNIDVSKGKSGIGILLGIMFNPIQGWKKLRRIKLNVETLQSGCFYPLLALLALSKFAIYFYSPGISLSSVITDSVIIFVSYFFGYFCILMTLRVFLSKELFANFESDFGKEYIIIGLSTLALFSIFTELLPMLWPILIFLPLWTIYLLYKGSRFFKLSESHVLRFMVLTCGSIIGMPILINWLLTEILPY